MSEAYSKFTNETMMTVPQPLRYRFIATTAALSLEDRSVEADMTAGNFTVTLPSVREACGLVISFFLAVGGNTLTIEDLANDAALTSITIEDTGDYILLQSDGQRWTNLGCGCGEAD